MWVPIILMKAVPAARARPRHLQDRQEGRVARTVEAPDKQAAVEQAAQQFTNRGMAPVCGGTAMTRHKGEITRATRGARTAILMRRSIAQKAASRLHRVGHCILATLHIAAI
jgi:hypothetical protein